MDYAANDVMQFHLSWCGQAAVIRPLTAVGLSTSGLGRPPRDGQLTGHLPRGQSNCRTPPRPTGKLEITARGSRFRGVGDGLPGGKVNRRKDGRKEGKLGSPPRRVSVRTELYAFNVTSTLNAYTTGYYSTTTTTTTTF